MDQDTKTIIRIRYEQAKDDLKWARKLYEQGGYRQAISRSYYAVFEIATAALRTQNIERKKHSGIESAFNRFFIKPGLIEPEFGAIYVKAFRDRLNADYAVSTDFTEQNARRTVENAERFFERLEKYLRDVGAIP